MTNGARRSMALSNERSASSFSLRPAWTRAAPKVFHGTFIIRSSTCNASSRSPATANALASSVVPQQEFLIDHSSDVGQHARPDHSRASLNLIFEPGLYMLLRFQKAVVRGNYDTGNQAFSMRLRFLTIRVLNSATMPKYKIGDHVETSSGDRRT
jgi:hypothetical protein